MRLVPAAVLVLVAPLLVSSLAAAASRSFPAVDPTHIDREAAACDDFYAFANGAFARVAIPDDYASWGVNEEIDERNEAILREILEDAARQPDASDPITRRLGDFFAAGMDETAIAAAGLAPLEDVFAAIAQLQSATQLPALLGRLHREGFGGGFSSYVVVDDRNSSAMILRLAQGGLGLPERDYYFDESAEGRKLREQYVAYIARLLALADEERAAPATADAQKILALETELARASRTLEALQDPVANYHNLRRENLDTQVAALDWAGYFSALALPASEQTVIVGQPEFFARFAALQTEVPLATWRAYLRWHVLDSVAFALPEAFEQAHFEFHGRILSGAAAMKPRWKRVLAALDGACGEDLGQRYVQRVFPPAAKAKAMELVRFTLAAMRIRLAEADWMSPETKAAARRKLDTMRFKIGYPEVWRDYSELHIARQPYVSNIIAARAFEVQRKLRQLGHPVDRNEWFMTPQTNNAYYDPPLNEMCFPAGILQPPFFDLAADPASNYGAIGATIGHELIHGFDDSGRQYDAEGNLRDWWTPRDATAFEQRAEFIVRQYDVFEVVPGVHLNGRQTLGENIADIGGLLVAFDAFRLATAGETPVTTDGFTPEQRFFVAFAQSWRTNMRPQRLRFLATADVHSTPRERVNGTVANLPAFFEAFGCTVPQNLPPPIW